MKPHLLATLTLLLLAIGPGTIAAAAELPDPGKLITVAELEPIVGKVEAGPKPVDAPEGAVASEFTLAIDSSWVTLTVFLTDRFEFEDAKRKFGGPDAVSVPEFGEDAFINPSVAGIAADLYAVKGNVVLEVSVAKGEGAVEKLRAIAKIALERL